MSPSTTVNEPARELPDSVSLDEFLTTAEQQALPLSARYQLVAQARVILEGLYVHLPLKRAMHAIDPVQRLTLLERRMDALS